MSFTQRTYARVGVVGNPSDGFEGKCISLSIKNFWAEASIQDSKSIQLIPDASLDNIEFKDFSDLDRRLSSDGYQGGLALLQATCRRFFEHCTSNFKSISFDKNFTLSYHSNIPRQVGLAGSSAIITSVMKCLIHFFDVQIPQELLPQLILEVETMELGISAGLQDRVVQVYEGLIYMNFDRKLLLGRGFGDYQRLKIPVSLPKFFLAYSSKPSNSGKIHSDVKQRWKNGDPIVKSGMKDLAALVEKAQVCLVNGDQSGLGRLMDENFNLRRLMYGDSVLGNDNIEMIRIARDICGCPCKFPGSGGAVLGLILDESKEEFVQNTFESYGYKFLIIEPITL